MQARDFPGLTYVRGGIMGNSRENGTGARSVSHFHLKVRVA